MENNESDKTPGNEEIEKIITEAGEPKRNIHELGRLIELHAKLQREKNIQLLTEDQYNRAMRAYIGEQLFPIVIERELYKASGHLTDNKLKSRQGQINMFAEESTYKLEPDTDILNGLSIAEYNVIHALGSILYDVSNIAEETGQGSKRKPSNELAYYMGNAPIPENIKLIEDRDRQPILIFRPTDLVKRATGKANYSGADTDYYIKILQGLSRKTFRIVYKRKYTAQGKKGKLQTLTDIIRKTEPLFVFVEGYRGLSDPEATEILNDNFSNLSVTQNKAVFGITLNPIFRDQIINKFILDFKDRPALLREAAKSIHTKTTAAHDLFLTFVLREIARERSQPDTDTKKEISIIRNVDTLIEMLNLQNYRDQKRKKLLAKTLINCFEIARRLNTITRYEKLTGTEGQPQFKFVLNLEFHKVTHYYKIKAQISPLRKQEPL